MVALHRVVAFNPMVILSGAVQLVQVFALLLLPDVLKPTQEARSSGLSNFKYSAPYPSKIVQSQEDENVKAKHEPDLASLSLGGQTLPLRPGYGTQGEYIVLRTDYFNLVPDPNVKIYRYSTNITPTADSRKNRQIIALFLGTDTFDSIGFGVATDYSTIAVTAQELDLRGYGYLEVSVR